jgi:hypothetical protein
MFVASSACAGLTEDSMYLINCTHCHTSFSNDARVCPKCGYMRRHVKAPVSPNRQDDEPVLILGEATWWQRTTYL